MDPSSSAYRIDALLDRCAAGTAGMIIYGPGDSSVPSQMSYRALQVLAKEKANLLRQHEDIVPGKVLLIHFPTHLDNIIWFWAAVLASCIPALSPSLVKTVEGRRSHFKHLNSLLDPICLTRRRLLSDEFSANDSLKIIAVETLEALAPSSPETNQQTLSAEVQTDKSTTQSGHSAECSVGYDESTNGCSADGSGPSRGDLAALMLTSGSTGNAKAVCLTHKQLFASINGKFSAMPLPQGSSLLNWVGLDHVASLVEIHLCAMFAGIDQVHVPAIDVLSDPILFLRLISKHHVARTFAPNFFLQRLMVALDRILVGSKERLSVERGSEYASSEEPTERRDSVQGANDGIGTSLDLRRLLYICSGGEPNKVDVCCRVSEHLRQLGASSSSIIVPGFGMTETCAGAIFNRDCPTYDVEQGYEFSSLGRCVPGIEMRVSPIHHLEMLAEDETRKDEYTLEVSGPIVFREYYNNPQATQSAFTSDGWFKTGDTAVIDANGNLKLQGRSKELININGVKYIPEELESAIEIADIPGVTSTYVACIAYRPLESQTEQVQVVYQHHYDLEDLDARMHTLSAIIRVIVQLTGSRPRVLPVPFGRLQKSTLGKLSRGKIRTQLERGQFADEEAKDIEMLASYRAQHSSGPRDEMERSLVDIFVDSIGGSALDMDVTTTFLDIGVSSVDLIRFKSAIEKGCAIDDLPIVTIMTHTTIRSLATAVRDIQASKYEPTYDPVVTLQHAGQQTPLWLLHPGIGEVLVFLGLVKYFPDRPVHALRARGFNLGESVFEGLSDIVTTYLAAIKRAQPQGPYALAGYSYGSMIAFEISKVLEAEGDVVQFLGCFNLPPHIKERMRLLDWTGGLLHIAHFCGIITEQRSEELVDELRALPHPRQVERVLAESDQKRCVELALTHSSLSTWIEVAWSLQKIGWTYDPSGSVANMDVFYCQPLKIVAKTREEYRTKKLNHWADFVQDLKFHEVGGEHYTMIGPDHVFDFQRTLKKALQVRGL